MLYLERERRGKVVVVKNLRRHGVFNKKRVKK